MPLHGESFAKTFDSTSIPIEPPNSMKIMGKELFITTVGKQLPKHVPGTPHEKDQWDLYHVAEDASEMNNLAKENPKKLKELVNLFDKEAEGDLLPMRHYGRWIFSNTRGFPACTKLIYILSWNVTFAGRSVTIYY